MNQITPFGSILFRDSVSTEEMREIWTDQSMVQKWMDVEGAIVEAQAALGMIPERAARQIIEKLTLEHVPVERIAAEQRVVGHLMVAFLKAFRDVCGPAAEHFHVGPTTQDIIDTGLTLQMRESHGLIMSQLRRLESRLCDRALEHRETVVMGRSHQQHAVPVTFGFVLAIWASEISDHIERARESEKRWLLGNLSAAVGAQNTFVELSDVQTARRLQEMVCELLDLGVPVTDLHTRTDRFAEVVTNLSELCSSLGELGLNIAAWQRPEVLEVEEPYDINHYSSSTMPNKVNPEPSEHVEGLAKVMRGLALAMQDIQMLDNRDATRMPVELVVLPSAYMMASRALASTLRNIDGLVVREASMLRNLNHPNVLGQSAAERVMIAMYKKTGQRDVAHGLLHRCAVESRRHQRPFKDVIRQDKDVQRLFEPEELEVLFDLSTYIGSATFQTDRAVRFIRARRRDES